MMYTVCLYGIYSQVPGIEEQEFIHNSHNSDRSLTLVILQTMRRVWYKPTPNEEIHLEVCGCLRRGERFEKIKSVLHISEFVLTLLLQAAYFSQLFLLKGFTLFPLSKYL